MIRQCKQGKIDIVLTKSISRFARNTVDCLNYVRALKELGIAVIFEKENMNTLEIDSEILITMLGAFAQSESESISANVRWGIRQAMKEGKATIQYKYLYGYRKGDDSKPEIIPDQAEVVRKIYDLFLSGTPVRGIQEYLNANSVPNINGESKWARSAIDSILTNEKYCGDVLLQKTYIDDCINKKVKKNTGQLPMYLVQNHHEGIISRETFDAAQAELARRSAGKSPSKKNAPTGRSRYSSKYALSDRLYCGECGTQYQRCTWRNRDGSKRILDVEQGIVCSVVITGTVNDGVNLAGDHLLSYLAIGAERARTVNVELYGATGLLVQLRCDTFKSSGNRVTCGKVMCKLDGYDIARIGRADCVGGAVGMLCSAVGAAASCEDRHAEHDAKK